MAKVAVVILNWNGKEFLKQFLPFLLKNTGHPDVELVVADNASSDDSLVFLKENYSDLRIIELDKNYGFAGGYNRALEQIESTYYLLLNSDIEVPENWLEPLVSFMDNHPEYAACAPMLLDFERRTQYEYAGAAGGYIDKYGYTFCRGRIFSSIEHYDSQLNEALDVFWTTGACMMVRAEVFRSAGGFDDHFFAHMEEVDLCWRIRNSGYKLAIVPESKVFHVGGGTLPKSNPFKTYLNFRNNLFLLYKNLPKNKLRKILLIRRLMDGLSAILFLLHFKFKDVKAIYKAHKDFRKKRADYRLLRQEKDAAYFKSDHPEIYGGSIVYEHFIKRKKSFLELNRAYTERMNKAIA